MDTFETSLILETDSNKEFKLSNTKKILLTKNKYTIHNSKYIYSIEDTKLVIYRIHPYKEIYSTDIKMDIDDILSINGDIYCISEKRLIKNMKESILLDKYSNRENKEIISDKYSNTENKYTISDKYSNRENKYTISYNIKEILKYLNNDIGIQYKNKLEIYNKDLVKIHEYDCNVSFYIEDILILGFKNILKIFIKDQSLEIFLEEDIKCITSNNLFSTIYCGSTSGKIYKINMDNSKNKILEYHEKEVKYLKMSFCNKYLYSCDIDNNILIWDLNLNVVVERMRSDSEIRRMDCFIMSHTLTEEKIPIKDF